MASPGDRWRAHFHHNPEMIVTAIPARRVEKKISTAHQDTSSES